MQLRLCVHAHINNDMQPILSESLRPLDKTYKYYNVRNGPLACLFQENRDAFICNGRDVEVIEAPLPFLIEENLFKGLGNENLN